MRIGIDATSLCRRITGMEAYALGLIKGLLEDGSSPHDYVIACRGRVHPDLEGFRGRAEFVRGPSSQILCEQLWLPFLRRRFGLDLVHYPAFPPGFATAGPYLATVFDGALWRDPSWLSWKARVYLAPLTRRAAARARKVLTISEFSREEIIRFTNADPLNVVNAGIAVHPAFRPVEDEDRLGEVRSRYGLPECFILSVGSLEPRKNLGTLLAAFAGLRREARSRDLKLVLAGRPAWGAGEVRTAIERAGLGSDVVLAGYVPFSDLPALYTMAGLFVYPSLYEGFGLPPVEAMACGTPVVCSNAGALPEAVGPAALTVDPSDAGGWTGAMRTVIEDRGVRDRLAAAGRLRAALFTWERVARAVIGVYNSLETTRES